MFGGVGVSFFYSKAFGLDPATTFEDVSDDADLASRLSDAYGGDIDGLDAFTGALAEGTDSSTGGVLGDLLVAAWSDQLTRSIAGDRWVIGWFCGRGGVAGCLFCSRGSRSDYG